MATAFAQSVEAGEHQVRFKKPTLEACGVNDGAPAANVQAVLTTDGRCRIQTTNTLNKNVGWIDTNDVSGFHVDRILSAEFIARISEMDSNATVYLGLCSAANIDPSVISELVWFKVTKPDSGDPVVALESKDGTTTVADEATNIRVPMNFFARYKLDLGSGIKSQSPPGRSSGGKSHIQYAVTASRGFTHTNPLTKFITLEDYADWLQLFVMVIDSQGTPASNTTLDIEGIDITYRRWLRQP